LTPKRGQLTIKRPILLKVTLVWLDISTTEVSGSTFQLNTRDKRYFQQDSHAREPNNTSINNAMKERNLTTSIHLSIIRSHRDT